MQFSLNYKSQYKQEADEVRCPVNQLGLLFPFIKNNPQKRYCIIVDQPIDEKVLEQINYVKEVAQDYTVQTGDIATVNALSNEHYNVYLRYPTVDWETFRNQQSMDVSDIYIDGPLGFDMDNLRAGKKNVKIRVSPTVSANASYTTKNNANSFFIRPEDLVLYKDVIDIIDFKVKNQEEEDALFTIYKRGTFDFDLSQLVKHLNITVPNLFVSKDFAKNRLNCGQRCLKPDSRCSICETQFSITNTLLRYFKVID